MDINDWLDKHYSRIYDRYKIRDRIYDEIKPLRDRIAELESMLKQNEEKT